MVPLPEGFLKEGGELKDLSVHLRNNCKVGVKDVSSEPSSLVILKIFLH